MSQLEVKGGGTTSATSSLNIMDSSGGSKLFVRDDGNVGIGTTTPGAKLQVVAPFQAGGPSGTLFSLGDNNGTAFSVANDTGSGQWPWTTNFASSYFNVNSSRMLGTPIMFWNATSVGFSIQSYAANATALAVKGAASQTATLQEWQNSSGTPLTVVDASGDVGIGTTNPATELEVSGSILGKQIRAINTFLRVGSSLPGSGRKSAAAGQA